MTVLTRTFFAAAALSTGLLLAACASPAGAPDAPTEATASDTEPHDTATEHGDAGEHDDAAMGTSIRIVEPADGAMLPAGSVIVRVEADDTAPEALHWHLKVDGESHNMIDGPETRLDLAPGAHVLTAVLSSGDDHMEDPEAPQSTVNITVEP